MLGLALLGAKSASLASQIIRLLSTLRMLPRPLLTTIHVAIEGVVVTSTSPNIQTHIMILAHLTGIRKLRFLSHIVIK